MFTNTCAVKERRHSTSKYHWLRHMGAEHQEAIDIIDVGGPGLLTPAAQLVHHLILWHAEEGRIPDKRSWFMTDCALVGLYELAKTDEVEARATLACGFEVDDLKVLPMEQTKAALFAALELLNSSIFTRYKSR